MLPTVDLELLRSYAAAIADWPERRSNHLGFVGYGNTTAGDKVLIAVDREYDPLVPQAIADALRDKGAKVDLLWLDTGEPDREFDELDEIRVAIRREPWANSPRRWEGIPDVEDFAGRRGYDLLIHGKGGPNPKMSFRYEQIPWLRTEHFLSPATVYPLAVHELINLKAWDLIWNKGRGGRFHLTDPEGTDLSWTAWEDYYDGTHLPFQERPHWGHLYGHPMPPILSEEDAAGVVAGTMNHFSRPFPRIQVAVDGGQIVQVDGGGAYGAAWRDLVAEGKDVHYPHFPRPGLFYLWEVAIGTHPKITRPSRLHLHSSGGTEWERRRSGVIHMGFGTRWRGPEEVWAGERGRVYGHLHIHLLFPTLVITAKDGTEYTVIRNGRLTALDDPEVRAVAAQHGDPDLLLQEEWIPAIPGISGEGSYADYARDPAAWIYREG